MPAKHFVELATRDRIGSGRDEALAGQLSHIDAGARRDRVISGDDRDGSLLGNRRRDEPVGGDAGTQHAQLSRTREHQAGDV